MKKTIIELTQKEYNFLQNLIMQMANEPLDKDHKMFVTLKKRIANAYIK